MTPIQKNILFLKKVERRLRSGGVLSARSEAEELVCHVGGVDRVGLFTGKKTLDSPMITRIDKALRFRKKGAPLSYILRERQFYGRRFFVNRDTLIPRPETEFLVQEALRILDRYYFARGVANPEVLDIGTGTGCIAVSLTDERPGCRMTAFDISEGALRVARKNIDLHGLRRKIRLGKSDLFGAARRKRFWDMIVSNPPYVPAEAIFTLPREVRCEPRLALRGGAGGIQIIERLLNEAPDFLKPRGWMLIEIGAGQSEVLRIKILTDKRYVNLRFVKDFNGVERVLIVQKA